MTNKHGNYHDNKQKREPAKSGKSRFEDDISQAIIDRIVKLVQYLYSLDKKRVK